MNLGGSLRNESRPRQKFSLRKDRKTRVILKAKRKARFLDLERYLRNLTVYWIRFFIPRAKNF